MNMRIFLFSTLMCFLMAACTQPSKQTQEASSDNQANSEQKAEESKVFGEAADFDNPVAYNAMVKDLVSAPADTLNVTVKGTVNEVCQAKGCWMTINGDESMMVKFKDYGFFVPKDISGREVVMHGKAFYQITPIEELQHYAEDAGKSAEEIAAITEPKRELRFLASGVLLLD